MSLDALVVLSVMLGAFAAAGKEWLSAPAAFMAGLCVVAVGGVLEPTEAVVGFASPVVLAIASFYVLAVAFKVSGLLDAMAESEWGEALWKRLELAGVAGAIRVGLSWLPGESRHFEADGTSRDRWIVAAAAGVALLAPVFGLLRIETALLLAATSIVATGALPAERARRAINWEFVVLVGAVIGFSRALVATGAVAAIGPWMPAIDPTLGLSASFAVLLSSALVISAFTHRRAAASVLPLVLSAGVFLVVGLGI